MNYMNEKFLNVVSDSGLAAGYKKLILQDQRHGKNFSKCWSNFTELI